VRIEIDVRLVADRTRGHRHVRAERDVLPHQRLHGALGHHQKHDSQLIGAQLVHPLAFIHLDKRRRAPAIAGTARDHAFAILGADDEVGVPQLGKHSDAARLVPIACGDRRLHIANDARRCGQPRLRARVHRRVNYRSSKTDGRGDEKRAHDSTS